MSLSFSSDLILLPQLVGAAPLMPFLPDPSVARMNHFHGYVYLGAPITRNMARENRIPYRTVIFFGLSGVLVCCRFRLI